jgi:Ca-activated chloride channel family protein
MHELGGTLTTIAKDVKIQVEFNPARVRAYRLLGYENRLMRAEEFNDDRKDAGELGLGHSVTALYEIVPPEAGIDLPGVDPLKYQSKEVRRDAFNSAELMTVKLRYKKPGAEASQQLTRSLNGEVAKAPYGSENTRFAAAVALFGMLLRDSKFKGESSFDECIALAGESRGADLNGYRNEFIKLAESAALMSRRE